jgi:hypothetical protein
MTIIKTLRTFLALTLGLLLHFCTSPTHPNLAKNDLERWHLKGSVLSVSETTFSQSGKYLTNISFNKDGYVTEQVSHNPDHSLIRRWIIAYDQSNLRKSLHCYVSNDSLTYVLHYYHDDSGNVQSIKTHRPNGTQSNQTVITYDSAGNKVRETQYDESNQIQRESLFTYKNNLLIEETHVDNLRGNRWKQMNLYNATGKREKATYASLNDSVFNCDTYQYNNDGLLWRTTSMDAKNKQLETLELYYNSAGDVIRRVKLKPDGSLESEQTHEYKYDGQSNWIRKSTFTGENVVDVVTRDLTYAK